MNTERFDEAIRKKLEGLDQKPTEQEVDQVVQHLTRKHVLKPRTGLRLSTVVIGVGSVVLVAALLFFALRYFNNDETSVNTPLIDNTADSLAKDSTAPEFQQPVTPAHMDVQPLPGERDLQLNPPQPKESQINAEIRGNLPRSGVRAYTEKSSNSLTPEEQGKLFTEDSNPAVTHSADGTDRVSKSGSEAEVPSGISGNQNIPRTEDTVETSLKQKVSAFSAEESAGNPPAVILQDTMAAEPVKSAVTESVTDQPGKTVPVTGGKPGNFRAELLRVGVVSQLASENLTFGAVGSFKLANGLGVDAGFRYMDFSQQKFDNKSDFDRHDHRKKNDRFDDKLRFAEPNAPISIHSNLIQVPVAITYSIPLPRRFSVELSMGTDLDLNLNQRLDYRGRPDSTGAPRDERFRTQGGAEFFNNLIFSAGVEKQWKSLVFQFSPFLRPQLKQVFYKPRETEFGFGLGVYYRFGLK